MVHVIYVIHGTMASMLSMLYMLAMSSMSRCDKSIHMDRHTFGLLGLLLLPKKIKIMIDYLACSHLQSTILDSLLSLLENYSFDHRREEWGCCRFCSSSSCSCSDMCSTQTTLSFLRQLLSSGRFKQK